MAVRGDGVVLFRWQFGVWFMFTLLRAVMEPLLLGVPRSYSQTPADREAVTHVIESIFPSVLRAEGAVFDTYVSNPAISNYALEEIAVPRLVVHHVDDSLASYENALAMVRAHSRRATCQSRAWRPCRPRRRRASSG